MNEPNLSEVFSDIQEASRLIQNGNRGEALLIYHDVKERTGRNPVIEIQLGMLCEEFGDVDEAILHYEIAIEGEPDNAGFLTKLGVAYLNGQEHAKAKETFEKVLETDPNILDVQHGLGIYHMHRSDFDKAVEHLERAVELKPRDVPARINLATSLANLNRHEPALKHINRAVQLDRTDPGVQLAHSNILSELGNMEESTRIVEQVLVRHPQHGRAYDHYARIRKFTDKDAPFIKKAEKALEKGMPPKERRNLLFALGKMHDDCGNYETAFSFYEKANLMAKSAHTLEDDEKIRRAVLKAFTAKTIETYSSFGNPSSKPVFIVGMPRSGTTLMERIIASHAEGAGSGELVEIPNIAHKVLPMSDLGKAARLVPTELTPENSAEYTEEYLAILSQGHGDAARIVDKMPGNSRFIGLIKSLFPNATIIHAMRNPLDIGLSCYFQNFASLWWTDDLRRIGKIYTTYQASMKVWHEIFPQGTILDVRYEDLIEDPETHARRMIEACGLEWDPSVLEFYKKKGIVRTASIAQTRRKIYKTSRARWMNYAEHLGPLVDEIAPFLEDDRELLAEHGVELPRPGLLKKVFG